MFMTQLSIGGKRLGQAHYHGRAFLLQRLLLGAPAAELLAELRQESGERRAAQENADESSTGGSWVATTDLWPIDGSWRPNPDALGVLTSADFKTSVEQLRDSLERQPIEATPTTPENHRGSVHVNGSP
jgi:hypothetical protein